MKRINYNILKPGYIIGTTMTVHPMAMITKITTAGIKNIFNPNISTHCLAVCSSHGLLYGVEMAWPIIRMVGLNEYEHGTLGNHIVFVAKIPDDYTDAANLFLKESHFYGIKYDILGLLEFWGLAQDSKKKLYCSELIREMNKKIGLPYPEVWDEKVSPLDLQRQTENNHIKWWKECV